MTSTIRLGASELERRFRRALRWYPRDWRERHGEAMLGVLLDAAEAEGMPRPSLGQRIDLARHGLAQHLLGGIPPILRDRAAASALLGATAFALFHFVFFEWEPWTSANDPYFRHVAPFSTWSAYLDLAWLLAALLYFCGWRRGGATAIAVTALGAAGLFAFHYQLPGLWPFATTMAVTLVAAPFVLAGAPQPAARPGLAVLATAGTAAAMALAFRLFAFDYRLFTWFRRPDSELWFLIERGRAEAVAALVLAVAVVAVAALLRRRALAATLGATLLPWLLFWSLHIVHDSFWAGGEPGVTRMRWLLACALAAVCLAAAVLWRIRPAESATALPELDDQEPLHG
ncbi:MAG TPA: hypothetical protein VGC45_16210 [Gryllotalpicola sp.]